MPRRFVCSEFRGEKMVASAVAHRFASCERIFSTSVCTSIYYNTNMKKKQYHVGWRGWRWARLRKYGITVELMGITLIDRPAWILFSSPSLLYRGSPVCNPYARCGVRKITAL